jgi:hypothetical protein
VTADEIPDFDLYAELEVSERASPETIQAAYRSLQLRHHPDRVGPDGADRAIRLNIARDWLIDPARRARYDAHLAGLRAQATRADVGGDDGEDQADEAADEAEVNDAADDGGLLHLLRRHLRIDVKLLGRVWIAALALLGAIVLVPSPVAPPWLRIAIAASVVLVLVVIGLGRMRAGGGGGLIAMFARWTGMIAGWLVLAVLAVEGVTALASLAAGSRTPPGIAEAAVPVIAAATVLSLLAVRRRELSAPVTVDDFLAMTPREFEEAVGDVLRRHGYRLAVTGGPGDLAADLAGTGPDGRPAVVQCKRYAPGHPVGSRDVQLLVAMGMRHHDAEHLVLVTTSEFTDPARDLADEQGVTLIDGADLEDLTR